MLPAPGRVWQSLSCTCPGSQERIPGFTAHIWRFGAPQLEQGTLESRRAGGATRARAVTRKLWRKRGAHSALTPPVPQPVVPNPGFFLSFLTWLGSNPGFPCRKGAGLLLSGGFINHQLCHLPRQDFPTAIASRGRGQ